MAFVDTVGTLIGLSARAGLLDENGNLPEIEKPMLADALATTVAPLLGTTTTGAYIDRPRGSRKGDGPASRPSSLPPCSCCRCSSRPSYGGPAPGVRGGPRRHRQLHDRPGRAARLRRSDGADPRFLTIALISFTYNLGVGMTAGIISYPLLKVLAGRGREVPRGLWILALLSLSFYVYYPYR